MAAQESAGVTDAIYLYMGILDAYEAIAEELLGQESISDQIVPRMIYYVKNFLPHLIADKQEEEITKELIAFLKDMKSKVYERKSDMITMDDVWEVRAAIFGYENVFLEVLGKEIIENYVFQRVAEILTVYLPQVFKDSELQLSDKLDNFADYIRKNGFVNQASHSMRGENVEFRVNYCAFSAIHGSKAYLDGNTRFCPWGMIANSIVRAHSQQVSEIENCKFTTRGSITTLEMISD